MLASPVPILLALALALTGATPEPPEAVTGATPEPDGGYPIRSAVDGWEGFFPPSAVDDLWLESNGLPFDGTIVAGVLDRVGKLVMDDGEQQAPAADLALMEQRYCTDPAIRAWNEDRCKALEARECEADRCTYRHYGNCSGLVYDGTTFLTAAHCVDGILEDQNRRLTSTILLPTETGSPPRRVPVGAIRVGKTDFDHHWVALDDEDPVDVASITSHIDPDLVIYPIAPLPDLGAPLFIAGYPRVEGRDPAAATAAGYALNFGTPTLSFGRLADPNPDDLPLCNVDGNQEHWALATPCPSGEVTLDDFLTYTGVITHSPILTTYDSCNGYSGAPVFDAHGRLVAINVTLVSDTNPQDRFVPHARMVAIPIARALDILTSTPEANPRPKRRGKRHPGMKR
jgi:hypothetical protein